MTCFLIKDGEHYILPYRLPLGRAILKRTNATPLTAIGNRYFFYTDELPVYEFVGSGADSLATMPDIVTLSERDSRHAYRFGDRLYIADCVLYEKEGTVYAEITKALQPAENCCLNSKHPEADWRAKAKTSAGFPFV